MSKYEIVVTNSNVRVVRKGNADNPALDLYSTGIYQSDGGAKGAFQRAREVIWELEPHYRDSKGRFIKLDHTPEALPSVEDLGGDTGTLPTEANGEK